MKNLEKIVDTINGLSDSDVTCKVISDQIAKNDYNEEVLTALICQTISLLSQFKEEYKALAGADYEKSN